MTSFLGRGWLARAACALLVLAPLGPARAEDKPERLSLPALKPWTGDLDGMVKRRIFRLIVPYSRTQFFIDRGRQFGVDAEFGQALEAWLNARHVKGVMRIHVVFVPLQRDEMLKALVEGRGDGVAANLTITGEREETVDFAAPWLDDVKEIVVAGPKTPPLKGIDDLAGLEVRVRKSSSYATHLAALNKQFKERGLKEMVIRDLPEDLEDEDALEMTAAGLLPLAIVDQHKAQVWTSVFPGLAPRPDLAISTGGEIAWAIRKDSPRLKAELAAFFASHRAGTVFGNTILKRYFGGPFAIKPAHSDEAKLRFQRLREIFNREGDRVSFAPLMLAAQGFQESTLNQDLVSPRGAVGVMQLLPRTAAAPPIGIAGVDRDAEANIRAGALYMRYLMDAYVKDPGPTQKNRILMTFAAYNAGPGNLRKFRRMAAKSGRDPNVWFNNVEVSAASVVGRETVQYVSNIYKYYIAYVMADQRRKEEAQARQTEMPPPK